MDKILNENLLSFAGAARHLPPNAAGCRVHISTLVRWRIRGVRGVRLEAIRIGGRWHTSREALARFAVAVTAAVEKAAEPNAVPDPRPAHLDLVTAELERAGI